MAESWERIWDCAWGGQTSTMRSMVLGRAGGVEGGEDQVPRLGGGDGGGDGLVVAHLPTRITSGSSCRAERGLRQRRAHPAPPRAGGRWPARGVEYSTGSSTVRMWAGRLQLMRWIMAARVVDLPLPVGPVTKISPRGLSANCPNTGAARALPGWERGRTASGWPPPDGPAARRC